MLILDFFLVQSLVSLKLNIIAMMFISLLQVQICHLTFWFCRIKYIKKNCEQNEARMIIPNRTSGGREIARSESDIRSDGKRRHNLPNVSARLRCTAEN